MIFILCFAIMFFTSAFANCCFRSNKPCKLLFQVLIPAEINRSLLLEDFNSPWDTASFRSNLVLRHNNLVNMLSLTLRDVKFLIGENFTKLATQSGLSINMMKRCSEIAGIFIPERSKLNEMASIESADSCLCRFGNRYISDKMISGQRFCGRS